MEYPIIKLGSKGDAVRTAQQQLIWRYYLPAGTDDGIFGPVTRNRVLQYQLDRDTGSYGAYGYPLTVDGIVGAQTWFRLAPDAVQNGSQGNGVRLLQQILKNYGYPPYDPGQVDGYFANATEVAVTAFQADNYDYDGKQLVADGIVGAKTWAALYS